MIKIDGYELDLARTVTHQSPAEVTEHPVESGADIADHKILRPKRLVIEGVVSSTPIGSLAERRQAFEVIDGESFSDPAAEARARMNLLLESSEPVTVETPDGVYRNMLMADLSANVDAGTGHAYVFTASFKQIRIVTNLRTTIRVRLARGSGTVNRGNKAPTVIATPPPAYLSR